MITEPTRQANAMINREHQAIKDGARNVIAPMGQGGGLVARGIAAIHNCLVRTRSDDDLYRQARAVFSQAEPGRTKDWSEQGNPALFSAFKIFQQLADKNYGKAFYPLSILCGGKDISDFLARDETAMHRRIPLGAQSWKEQADALFKSQSQDLAQRAFDWCFANQANVDTALWCDLGDMYLYGHGVKHDNVQAAAWFRKAAEHGSALAQAVMAISTAKASVWQRTPPCPRNGI